MRYYVPVAVPPPGSKIERNPPEGGAGIGIELIWVKDEFIAITTMALSN